MLAKFDIKSYLCSRLEKAYFYNLKFIDMFAIVTIAGQQK